MYSVPEHLRTYTWAGRPIEDLTREELIEALKMAADDMQRMRESAQQDREMRKLFRDRGL